MKGDKGQKGSASRGYGHHPQEGRGEQRSEWVFAAPKTPQQLSSLSQGSSRSTSVMERKDTALLRPQNSPGRSQDSTQTTEQRKPGTDTGQFTQQTLTVLIVSRL